MTSVSAIGRMYGMKTIILSLVFAVCANCLAAVEWNGLSDKNYYSGPKLTSASLKGKVVLVDCWGVACPPCRALLPQLESLWKTFKSRPFVLVGNHCQGRQQDKVMALVKENNLTYPIYDWFGLAKGTPSFRGIPFLYVVDHRGTVVYSGHSLKDATSAIKKAIAAIGEPEPLYGSVTLDKFKGMEDKLRLGKSIRSELRALNAAAKGRDEAAATEAKAILEAIGNVKLQVQEDIKAAKVEKPAEAKKLMKMYKTTWPGEKEI